MNVAALGVQYRCLCCAGSGVGVLASLSRATRKGLLSFVISGGAPCHFLASGRGLPQQEDASDINNKLGTSQLYSTAMKQTIRHTQSSRTSYGVHRVVST